MRLSTWTVLIAASVVVEASTADAASYAVGQQVLIEYSGTWYEGTVLEAKDGKWKIHYDGWADSWDEWVGADRLKAAAKPTKAASKATTAPAAGSGASAARAMIRYNGIWYPGQIIETKGAKRKFSYFGWDAEWDTWVDASSLKAMPAQWKVGQKVEVNHGGVRIDGVVKAVKGDSHTVLVNGGNHRFTLADIRPPGTRKADKPTKARSGKASKRGSRAAKKKKKFSASQCHTVKGSMSCAATGVCRWDLKADICRPRWAK